MILQYMYEQGYITKEEQEEALADDVYSRIQDVDAADPVQRPRPTAILPTN